MGERIKSPLGIGCLAYGVVFIIVILSAGGPAALVRGGLRRPTVCFPAALWLGGTIPGIVVLSQKHYFQWFSSLMAGLGCLALAFLVTAWLITGPFFWIIALLVPPRHLCPHCGKAISPEAAICPHCGTPVETPQPKQVA